MEERGESSSSHQFLSNEFVYAHVTPTKPGQLEQPDPNMMCRNWLQNPFDEVFLEETSVMRSFSCWDGGFGSTSQSYNPNINGGMCNMFSMDDVETWNISCQDLLAIADAGIRKDGQLNLLHDLNSVPQMVAEPLVSTGLSLQFTPLTPDQTKRDERMNLAAENGGSTLVEGDQDSEKGLAEQTNLNETPQKPKRRKHRPKVVTEGKPKRVRKPATPKAAMPKPDGSSTGKRKYVRRKGVEKSTATPGVEETSGTIHPSSDQEAKKTCKRKINFDESEKQAEVNVEKVCTMSSEVVEHYQKAPETEPSNPSHLENYQKAHETESSNLENHQKTHETESSNLENHQKTHEIESSNPITPSKTELPQGKLKRKYTKAKSKIDFLQKAPNKGPIHVPSPNESGCSTNVCNKGDEAQRSKGEISSETYGNKLLHEHNVGIWRNYLGSALSMYTDYDSGTKQCTQLSVINKKKEGKAREIPKDRYTQARGQNSKKKIMVHDSMVPSLQHYYLGYNDPNIRWESIYDIDALVYRFERLHINSNAVVPYMSGYHEKNALVLYQHDRSLVPYEGSFNPMNKRKQRPKVDLDDETNRVWMLLLENINSQGIDGTDEDKAKWWEEERRVFRGRVNSFIARMHLVQGDRRFSRWKGSVLDSVVGVFLTQNVSDHLSSSAFMSLAARYPLKPTTSSEPLHEEESILSVKEPCHVDKSGDHGPMMLQEADSCDGKTVNSIEFSKNCVDLNSNSECDVIGHIEVDVIVSSQKSADTRSMHRSEEQKDSCKTTVSGCASSVELLPMHGPTRVCERVQNNSENCASEESGISSESASQTTVQMVNTISSQESTNSNCMVQQVEINTVQMVNTISSQESANSNFMVQQVEITNLSTETSKVSESNNIAEASAETVQKVVDFHLKKIGSNQIINGVDKGSSKVKKEKTEKPQTEVDWDKLRLEAEVKQKRERTPDSLDSMDYEAIKAADVNDVADAIKERGMNNRLAARIKDMLDRLVQDHGSLDLEWLRDVPPDKAKEYLLSYRGLGLKSVECIRLLTLHHLAFPVDTNVGRIAVRLGWVPLQPLPESLQLHLLELYPVQETIQKYLWPRLCKLDQRTLYELHYQMITFGKVFCTKTKPNCHACPLRGECRHFASAFASARLSLPAPEESMAHLTENRTGQNPIGMIDLPSTSEQPKQVSELQHCNPVVGEPPALGPIVEVPATPGPTVEVPSTPGPIVEVSATQEPIVEVPASPEPEQIQQVYDIEDFGGDDEEIPMIKLNIEAFTQNLQTYMESHMELGEGDMSKALVALTTEAASIPTPKLKNINQLRTEHQVYELPDSHPLLEGLDKREPDDPCFYLLAIWTPGETADSIQPPEGQCSSQESGTLCNEETCFFCNSTREANSQTVRGTLLIPCRTAMRGSFPLNGTYFQVNEVFADHDSSLNPIDVPRAWLWNLPRRTVYFGTSIPTIFKGLTTEDIQFCFWRGFVCVRGFDQKTRAPRPLMARLHFPASRLKQSRPKTDEKVKLTQ